MDDFSPPAHVRGPVIIMAGHENLYTLLGVSRDASADDIRDAYRRLAKRWHPDRSGGDESRFKAVTAAYEVLGDARRRELYDEFGEISLQSGFDAERARAHRAGHWRAAAGAASPGAPFHGGPFHGFGPDGRGVDAGDWETVFADMFGHATGRSAEPPRGRDVRAEVELDFLDALRGAELELILPDGGTGERVKVRIPPGADDGSVLTVRGKGQPGRGGERGDLLITTRVRPHPVLRRQGLDLHMTVPVTLDEIYNGARIEVPTPDGDVRVAVPSRSQPGTKLRLRGKGVARGDQRGDLHVELELRLPDRHDAAFAEAAKRATELYAHPLRDRIRL